MGRPINKKYFANTNAPYQDQATGGPTGQGGEGLTGVTVGSTGTNYSTGATLSFSNPQLPGGVVATGSLSLNAFGNVTTVNLDSAGTGYTSTATFSVTTASSVSIAGTGTSATTAIYVASTTGLFAGMIANGTGVGTNAKISTIGSGILTMSVANANDVSGTIKFVDAGTGLTGFVSGLTSSQQNGIAITAFVPGGSSGVIGDIMKQEASRRYLVKTAQGQGQCILVTTSTLTAGEMFMTAVDVTGASYFVDKLTARRARLYRYLDNGGTFEVANGGVSGWSLDAATTGTVQVVSN
jgi:hypothetical protein